MNNIYVTPWICEDFDSMGLLFNYYRRNYYRRCHQSGHQIGEGHVFRSTPIWYWKVDVRIDERFTLYDSGWAGSLEAAKTRIEKEFKSRRYKFIEPRMMVLL